MLEDVLHLDGQVEGQVGKRSVRLSQDVHRVAGGVEEVGIAEGDVARTHADQSRDVGHDVVESGHPVAAVVNRRDRTMAAAVPASMAGLDVAGQPGLAVDLQTGVVSRAPAADDGPAVRRSSGRDRPGSFRSAASPGPTSSGLRPRPPARPRTPRRSSGRRAARLSDRLRRPRRGRRRRSGDPGRMPRSRVAAWTASRMAVCIGTENATASALWKRCSSHSSTARSRHSTS